MPVIELNEDEPVLLRFIGAGARFPWDFDGGGGANRIKVEAGMERISGSIKHILSTRVGERFMQPDFGSNLPDLIFEPLDDILRQQLFLYTVSALRKWEKRIVVETVAFDDDEFVTDQSTIHIFIEYRLINSQVRGNYVFPFERTGRPVTDSINENLI